VQHGVTGFHCGSVDEAAAAVGRLGAIDRAAVRAECERRFSHDAIVHAYEQLYQEVGR
jgi:hypothetical protein